MGLAPLQASRFGADNLPALIIVLIGLAVLLLLLEVVFLRYAKREMLWDALQAKRAAAKERRTCVRNEKRSAGNLLVCRWNRGLVAIDMNTGALSRLAVENDTPQYASQVEISYAEFFKLLKTKHMSRTRDALKGMTAENVWDYRCFLCDLSRSSIRDWDESRLAESFDLPGGEIAFKQHRGQWFLRYRPNPYDWYWHMIPLPVDFFTERSPAEIVESIRALLRARNAAWEFPEAAQVYLQSFLKQNQAGRIPRDRSPFLPGQFYSDKLLVCAYDCAWASEYALLRCRKIVMDAYTGQLYRTAESQNGETYGITAIEEVSCEALREALKTHAPAAWADTLAGMSENGFADYKPYLQGTWALPEEIAVRLPPEPDQLFHVRMRIENKEWGIHRTESGVWEIWYQDSQRWGGSIDRWENTCQVPYDFFYGKTVMDLRFTDLNWTETQP